MNETLEELARRAKRGDAAALDGVARRLADPLFRLAFRMLGDVGAAEDATQEILVKVVTNLGSFEERSSLRTWAHTIAVRHILAEKASQRERAAFSLEQMVGLLDMGMAYGASEPRTPEDDAFVAEVRLSCAQGMLLSLGRDERLLVLVELLGFDAVEAAAIADCSHQALRQRLSRGREKLGSFLQTKCGVVTPDASCRCEGQVPAKRARMGNGTRLTVLSQGDLDQADLGSASEECRAIRAVFAPGGMISATEGMRQRILAAMPTMLARE